MALKLTTNTRNVVADAVGDLLINGGTLQIRTGSAPASADNAATGTLLATFTLPSPTFGSPSNGTVTAVAITDATAGNTGNAGYYRVLNNSATTLWQGAVTAVGGGGELQLDTIAITTGNLVHINSWTITNSQS